MKTGIASLILILFCPLLSLAQLKPVYSFQKDDSTLKKSWYDLSIKKKDQLLSTVKKDELNEYKKLYNERLDEVKLLVKTSRSVTDPEVNGYLQSIVQKIIAANPSLKGTDARVFFSRDWWPNAYSVGDGTIAVNAGLLIFLENEAE